MTNKTPSSQVRRQLRYVKARRERGLKEVRGLWLPEELHAKVKDFGRSLVKK